MNKAISITTNYEVYVYLYGYSMGWINTIQNAVLDYSQKDEDAEAYTCSACMAVRFTSTDKSRVGKLCAKVNSLLALAKKTYVKDCFYNH
ncbi:MAG: hypothetical protein ABFD15_09135 [Methanofastidiosum sp.]